MTKVRIYQSTKNAMQSGRAKTGKWILEYETTSNRTPEPLMGWVSSGDTLNQVSLKFDSRDEAIAFAENKNWEYVVTQPRERRVTPRNFGDNFRYRPPAKTEKK